MAIFYDNGIAEKCDQCDGTGRVDKGECPVCEGMGDVKNKLKWRVEFTIGVRDRAEKELDWDAFEQDDLALLNEPTETELQVNLLWLCVEEQANLRGITEEQFATRLGGDAIMAGYKALMESLKDFFTGRGAAPLATAIGKWQRAMDRVIEKTNKRMGDLDLTDAEIDALIEKQMGKAQQEKERILQSDVSGK